MSRRIYTADAGMALLAVALVVVAFALAHCADLIGAPTDAQADADTAASMADAIAAARAARATDHHARAVRVAAAPH